MKKYIKLLSALALAACLCLSFCSCRQLDQMKARHAKYSTVNGEIVVELNGNIYKRLSNKAKPVFLSEESVVITDPSVPVLLSNSYGDYCFIDSDAVLMSGFDQEETFYCREDKFEQYNSALNNAVLDHYGYYDDFYNSETGKYETKFKVVGDDITEAVNATLAGTPIDESTIEHSIVLGFSLEICDADGIAVGDTLISIKLFENGTCFISVPSLDGEDNYPVSQEYLPIMSNLFNK